MTQPYPIEKLSIKGTFVELGLPVALILLFTGVYLYFGEALFYNRPAIDQGQWWRIWTGQWAHLNVNHTLMNLSGFVMIYFVFRGYQTRRSWLLSLILLTLWVGFALYVFDEKLHTYAGLSGALHGFLIIGLCYSFRHMPWLTLIAAAVIFTRVYMEQQPDYDKEYIKDFIDGLVYVDAHFYGVIGGFVFGVAANAKNWFAMPMARLLGNSEKDKA